MWLLSMYFIRQLYSYSGIIHDYYKSYYISKAWLELWLVGIANNPIGLNMSEWENSTLNKNFSCNEESWNCFLDMKVVWQSIFLSENFRVDDSTCTEENALSLSQNWQMIVPLFTAGSTNDHISKTFKWLNNNNSLMDNISIDTGRFSLLFPGNSPAGNINIGIISLELEGGKYVNDDYWYMYRQLILNKDTIKSLFDEYYYIWFSKDRLYYLVLWNPTNDIKFCIQSNSSSVWWNTYKLPTPKYYIESVWYYRDDVTGLNAVRTPAILNI